MKNPKKVVREGLGRPISCGATARTVALTAVLAAAAALWALPALSLAAPIAPRPLRAPPSGQLCER